MVMDADGFFQLHDTFAWQPIRVCNATMTSVAFQLASGPKEPLKKKKARALHCFFFLSAALLDRMRAGTQLMSSLRRAPLLHGYGC